MPHYHHRTFDLDDYSLLLKLELESSYPQEPQLLLRADNEACEGPLSFERQTYGQDEFSIRMNASVSFEYAVRVDRPDPS